MILGAQFFTLREQCQTLEGISESLARVADIGYTTVQISGTCEYDPQWLAEELRKNGLRCVITHSSFEKLKEQTAQVIADHEVLGCDHIGLGIGPNLLKDMADVESVVDLAHTAGAQIAAAGKTLMYHNHNCEFRRDCTAADGSLITRLEYILERVPANELGFTLDTYWVQAGGADVVKTIGMLGDRIPCVHLKDMNIEGFEQRMAPVGYGNLNWDSILPALEMTCAEYALVEQDMTYGEDPFECLRKSYEFLNALGLK